MQHVSFEYFNQHDMVIAANVSIDFCFVYQNPILILIFNSIFRKCIYISLSSSTASHLIEDYNDM